MKASLQQHVIGVPISSAAFLFERSATRYLPDLSGQYNLPSHKHGSPTCKQSRGRVRSILSSMHKLGKKLTLGARILQVAGPIAGLLFISTDKIAFCSEKPIKISCPSGEFTRIHYKVLIPLRKIKTVNQSENVKKPSQKYIDIVTVDNFEFWFMGFIDYQRAFKYLQQAITQ
ncbi:hypothetical protein SLA2020_275140 [Shorea laevis]